MPTAPAMPSCCRPARCWREMADQVGELPVDILQTLFWSLDPWLAVKKFGRFLGMDQQGDSARDFVLLEDWLNEGAPLAGPTARECLVGWYGDNLPGAGKWMVGGRRIVPSQDQRAGAGHDPVGRSHRAALVGGGAGRAQARPEERHAPRPAARPYRHGGERPRPRSLLDAADRLAGATSRPNARDDGGRTIASTGACRRSGPCCWRSRWSRSTYVDVADEARRGIAIGFGRALVIEGRQPSRGRRAVAGALLAASPLAAQRRPAQPR